MWHEARKQERLIRGLIVDYRRRAERRRDFYEKINADSTQILQVHGRPCKIHLEPAVAHAGDSSSIMMPWQGDHNNIIDRFDVRAHLDYIPDVKTPDIPPESLGQEERNCNYERYRILAQNLFLGISEDKFLHQLAIEEQFGITADEKESHKEKLNEKKGHGASIGYNYDDPSQSFSYDKKKSSKDDDKDESEEESDMEILDVDLSIDVNKVEPSQAHAMNACGANFGMMDTDLFSFLTGDAEEAERHRQQMREEKEKALFSGRKSRRQRRAHRDKLLATRVVSPPHYAARPSPTRQAEQESPSPTRSPSPPDPNIVTYITSFGDDDDQLPETGQSFSNKISYADKVRMNIETKTYASVLRDPKNLSKRISSPKRSARRSPYSKSRRSRSRSRNRSRRSRSKSRTRRSRRSRHSKSRSRSRRRTYTTSSSSRSRSRSSGRSKSSFRSRSRSSRSSSSTSSDTRKGNKYSVKSSDAGHSANVIPIPPAPIVRMTRYYGRKREGCKSSSSELSVDSSDDQSNITDKTNENMAGSKTSQVSNVRSSGSTSKPSSSSQEKLSLKERLRRKMQAQLTKQLRADKKAEAERLEREQQLQQERDDEMREMAIKIRRRQREMRHQRRASYSSREKHSSSSSSSDSSTSRSRSPNYKKQSRSHEKKYDDSPPSTKKYVPEDTGPPGVHSPVHRIPSHHKDHDRKGKDTAAGTNKDDKKYISEKKRDPDRHYKGDSNGSDSKLNKQSVRRLVDY